jgi:predicted DNA-binding protein
MFKNKNVFSKITPQYIVDNAGKKTGVILDISAFEQLLEEIEDLYFASVAHQALQNEDEHIPHEIIKRKLTRKK